MLQLTASYHRKPAAERHSTTRAQMPFKEDDALAAAVWQLLDTPQTIESMSRVVSKQQSLETADCQRRIQTLMQSLFERELIELSPDS